MLDIYECFPEVCIDGEWRPCTLFARTRALESPIQVENWYHTFSALVRACENTIVNAEVTTTFYKKKTLCKISVACEDLAIRITEKNFRTVGFRWRYELNKDATMRYLANNLPAEDFVKWATERNLSVNFN